MIHKSAKSTIHPAILEKLKTFQEEFKPTFRGVDAAHTGRPGTANIVNFKRNYKDTE